MKKFAKSLSLLAVFALASTVCAAPLDAFKDLEGKLDIAGGTAHIPVMTQAARDIMTFNPKIRITVAGGGSGVGVKQVGEGLAQIDDKLLRRMIYHNDVYIFKIEDAFLTTADVFDLDAGRFEDSYLSSNKALHEEEVKLRKEMDHAAERAMTPYRVFFRSISKEEEIIDALVELFRRRRGA